MATADPMQPFPGPPAWDRPGTRSAWTAHLLGHLGRAAGWALAAPALLFLHLWIMPAWTVVLVVPAFVVFVYGFLASLVRLQNTLTMLRILRTYPWREQPDAVRLKKGKAAVFALPDPDRPETTVSPKEPGLFTRKWDRIARRGFAEELWYAGDPRFAVVVARPGPRALGYARQPQAFDRRTDPRRRGISPEARRRALAIRARVSPARED